MSSINQDIIMSMFRRNKLDSGRVEMLRQLEYTPLIFQACLDLGTDEEIQQALEHLRVTEEVFASLDNKQAMRLIKTMDAIIKRQINVLSRYNNIIDKFQDVEDL